MILGTNTVANKADPQEKVEIGEKLLKKMLKGKGDNWAQSHLIGKGPGWSPNPQGRKKTGLGQEANDTTHLKGLL